ncbi:hypothetical protein PMG11_05278 [Penicillium brasilianum]|uniref:MARVEL domain-containing protein n=1 Tax=Penicillium brasilianum TaxID=104259 RepID=A0A0F7VK33_PENBI|nr:hypothetical protein PMG11_05278 [Penicillium brasilianum]
MRSRASVKPSDYPTLPFHGIRFVSFLSSFVVTIILAIFIYHLHADGYKLPFAFLVLLVTSLLSLLTTLLTSLSNCCCGLSPKFSLALNIPLLFLWLLSLALLAYSMSGTILTKCTTTYWATSTALSVCRSYKALFTFTVVGTAAYIAAIWLDVVVRRRQTRLGAYGPMGSSAAVGEDPWDVKLAERRDSSAEGLGGRYDSVPQPAEGRKGAARVRFGQGYQHPAEQTGYDPAAYR